MEAREHTQANLQLLREELDGGQLRSARRMIHGLHPGEIARLLESMPPRERAVLWEMVEPDDEGDRQGQENGSGERECWDSGGESFETRVVDRHLQDRRIVLFNYSHLAQFCSIVPVLSCDKMRSFKRLLLSTGSYCSR